MKTAVWLVALCGLAVGLGAQSATWASAPQEPEKSEAAAQTPAEDDGATIRGKIIQLEKAPIQIEIAGFEFEIAERIQHPPMPVPPEWPQWTVEQRRNWVTEFQQSEDGKKFFAERLAREQAQHHFSVKVESDGSFEVFDVPPAEYNLFGRKDVEVDSKKYAVEVYGELQVGDVDILELQPLPLESTRLLDRGDEAPDVQVDAFADGGEPISLSKLRGRPILIYFWTALGTGAANQFTVLEKVSELLSADPGLLVLPICTDKDLAGAQTLAAERKWTWPQGRTLGWDHPVFTHYGLRSIPTLYLLDKDGKIILTSDDLMLALEQPGEQCADVLRDAIAGKIPDEGQ